MKSFHDIFNFLWNPFTEVVLLIAFFACVYMLLSRAGMSKALMAIPAIPWLGAYGIMLYFWSQVNWSTSESVNSYGLLPAYVTFNEEATGLVNVRVPGWIEFLLLVILIGLIANAALVIYAAVVRWPVQKVREELEAAVVRDTGRQAARRSSAFVGDTGIEPSAPVSALLSRPPQSRLAQAMEGSPQLHKARAQSDAERVAALQRDVQQGAGAPTAPPTGAAAVSASAGAGATGAASQARLAELINSIQPTTAGTLGSQPVNAGHCTRCGVALTVPDHHSCPVPGGEPMFCGNCGAPHEPKASVCAACGSPLARN